MLGVIDYGGGNFRSVCNALNYLEIPYKEISQPEDFEGISHIILPGVGAFKNCIDRLHTLNLVERLKRELLDDSKFFLGICVGHQILSSFGTEFEEQEGLNLIPGKTIKLEPIKNFPVPHVGWTEVKQLKKSELFKDIENEATFYFVHSFYIDAENQEDVLATVSYGKEITAVVGKGNIFGIQFHPEKSQANGLQLLKNFSEMKNESLF